MKKIILLLLSITALKACSPYQEAYKSEDPEVKLQMIDTLIKEEKYSKALTLFEQIVNRYRGTDKAEELSIKYANSFYYTGDYLNSAYQFDRFVQSHPTSKDKEYAMYMAAKSYYEMSPEYSNDQRDTERALVKLQDYIDTYPGGKFTQEANALVEELRLKLDRKAYEIAKNYHHRNRYISAIRAFENFISAHPGSQYLDDAQFYLLESQYLYAINSTDELIPERIGVAIKFYNTFVSRFPASEYRDDADKIMESMNEYK
jgi:outer membrane protein assembly factor BamD